MTVTLFHGLGEGGPHVLPDEVVIEPPDRCFHTLHVVREDDINDDVSLPDVRDHDIDPTEEETQLVDDSSYALQ